MLSAVRSVRSSYLLLPPVCDSVQLAYDSTPATLRRWWAWLKHCLLLFHVLLKWLNVIVLDMLINANVFSH